MAGESIMKEGGGSTGPSVCLRLHSSFGGSALPRLPVVVVMDQMWANCQGMKRLTASWRRFVNRPFLLQWPLFGRLRPTSPTGDLGVMFQAI